MDGLIPLVYRAIRKNSTRRQYECLSSGAPQSHNHPSDSLYVNGERDANVPFQIDKAEGFEAESNGQRRRRSTGDFPIVDGFSIGTAASPVRVKKQQLVKFRSHRN